MSNNNTPTKEVVFRYFSGPANLLRKVAFYAVLTITAAPATPEVVNISVHTPDGALPPIFPELGSVERLERLLREIRVRWAADKYALQGRRYIDYFETTKTWVVTDDDYKKRL